MHSPTAKPGGGGEGEIRKTHRMKKKKTTSNYWQLFFYLITHCAPCPRHKSLLAGWHSLYLHTQCPGEHFGEGIPTYLGTNLGSAGSSLSEGLSQIRGDALLCSHKPQPLEERQGTCLELMTDCPRAVHPHSHTVQVLWKFLPSQRAAQLCQRHLPLHGGQGRWRHPASL